MQLQLHSINTVDPVTAELAAHNSFKSFRENNTNIVFFIYIKEKHGHCDSSCAVDLSWSLRQIQTLSTHIYVCTKSTMTSTLVQSKCPLYTRINKGFKTLFMHVQYTPEYLAQTKGSMYISGVSVASS